MTYESESEVEEIAARARAGAWVVALASVMFLGLGWFGLWLLFG